jgi:hypothetical protein
MDKSFEEQKRLERARKKVESIKGFYKHFGVYILVNIFLIASKWFTLDPDEEFFSFGTFATAFFWGIGVAFHAFGVFGTNMFLGNDWEERKIKEYMEKQNKTNKWE